MKENIDIHYVFNLVDSNGTKLQLRLGRYKCSDGYLPDKGFRWSFVGSKIPMPIRSYTWFNGFPENIMLDWLKGNGWALRSRVDMGTGKATIYELPKAEEPSKGNDTYVLPDYVIRAGERAFREAIKTLYNHGSRIDATNLYRYVHPTCLFDANDAIKAIVFDTQQ